MMSRHAGMLVLAAVVSVTIVALLDPIAQDPGYHAFADDRAGAGLPHVANVLSNLPFVLVGALGLWRARRAERSRAPLLVFFAGVLLTGFGSGWYHLAPDDARLVWDRLPLGASCMALLVVIIDRRLGPAPARRLLAPLVLFGLGSVAWWAWGNAHGTGDLRVYGLAQFFPMLGILVLLWPAPRDALATQVVCRALACYVAAKGAEHWDGDIYALGYLVSGHTFKHLLAAAGAACLLPLAKPEPQAHSPARGGGAPRTG